MKKSKASVQESQFPTVKALQRTLDDFPAGLRNWILQFRDLEAELITTIQSYRSMPLDMYARFMDLLGEELGILITLPLCCWMAGDHLAVHMTILMSISIGLGNYLKNYFAVPRPEVKKYKLWVPYGKQKNDHGLPSTHTICGFTLPFYFFLYHSSDESNVLRSVTPLMMFLFAVLYSVSQSTSRLYLSYHSPSDVAAGYLMGFSILFYFFFSIRFILDSWVTADSSGIPFGICFFGMLLHYFHPDPRDGSQTGARAESGLVFGTMTGSTLASWVNHNYLRPLIGPTQNQIAGSVLTLIHSSAWLFAVSRIVVGIATVFAVRAVVKKLFTAFWRYIMHLQGIKEPSRFELDPPVKFMCYAVISFSVIVLAKIAFYVSNLRDPLVDFIPFQHL